MEIKYRKGSKDLLNNYKQFGRGEEKKEKK